MRSKKIERQSNFELMRIISMFMIIIWHIIIFKCLLDTTTGSINFILDAIKSFCNIHVNSFVLLLGYFQCNKKMKFRKILSIINASWFYRLLFVIMSIIIGISLTPLQIVRNSFVLSLNQEYWFITCYLIVYFLSPFLNKFIHSINKKQFQKVLVILFLLFSILSTLTAQEFLSTTQGYSVYSFIFLYFIGAYLNLYPIKESYFFKRLSKVQYRFVLIFAFFFFYLFNFSFHFMSMHLQTLGHGIISDIGRMMSFGFWAYDNPLIILETICYFSFFHSLVIKNRKVINTVASTTIGIYLIHENPFLKNILYNRLLFFPKSVLSSWRVLLYLVVYSILIFIACFVIEFIRQKIIALMKRKRSLYDRIDEIVSGYLND